VPRGDQDCEVLEPLAALSDWMDGQGVPSGPIENAQMTGRNVSHADWYEVLAYYKLGAMLEATFARACAGRAPKETGDFLHASTLALFSRAIQKIF
jgi:hypothetical protein